MTNIFKYAHQTPTSTDLGLIHTIRHVSVAERHCSVKFSHM